MSSRTTRRSENQDLFRMGNTRLNEAVDERVPLDARLPFLCECAEEACNARVEIGRPEWEDIASRPNHFVIVRGHAMSDGEVVVGAIEGYDIVRKPD